MGLFSVKLDICQNISVVIRGRDLVSSKHICHMTCEIIVYDCSIRELTRGFTSKQKHQSTLLFYLYYFAMSFDFAYYFAM